MFHTQTQNTTKPTWKERRAISANALARLNANNRNDIYIKVLAAHAESLKSDDRHERELAEGIVNAYRARDMNRLIRAVNRDSREAERFTDRVKFVWLIPVPLSWMGLEINMLGSDDAIDPDGCVLLMDKNNLCFGLEAHFEDFIDYHVELKIVDSDPTYAYPLEVLTDQELAQMFAGVEECRVKKCRVKKGKPS
jgi:hypothetical protein